MRIVSILCLIFALSAPYMVSAQKAAPKGKRSQAKKNQKKTLRAARTQARPSRVQNCAEGTFFFGKKCRSKAWFKENLLGDSQVQSEIPTAIVAPVTKTSGLSTRLNVGNTLYELSGKKVPAHTRGSAIKSKARRSKGKATAKAKSKGKRKAQFKVRKNIIPAEFRKGDYMVERRLTFLKPEAGNQTDYRVRIQTAERRTDGTYRWKTVQTHTFDPLKHLLVCPPGQLCANAYGSTSCGGQVRSILFSGGGMIISAIGAGMNPKVGLAGYVTAGSGLVQASNNYLECLKNKPEKSSK